VEQGEARELARRLNALNWLTWVAISRDRANGEWEETNEWGVQANDGLFYTSLDDLPGIVKERLTTMSD
jgi:hypothetical protein